MPNAPSIESLLRSGSAEWNKLRKAGKVPTDHTGATFAQLFSANTDLSGLSLVGTEWEACDLSKVSFRDADLSNAYFHGGRLQDCDFHGANLEGATFEKLKLLRCDFTQAKGLEDCELDDVDMDRVVGLDGEEAPPPPPPPAHGITSFTREQKTQHTGLFQASVESVEPVPFRPQDAAGTLLFRGIKRLGPVPAWVLDAPGQRPPLPQRMSPGSPMEAHLREAVKTRLEGARPTLDPEVVKRAQKALRLGTKEAPVAAMYLREVGTEPEFRFSAEKVLRELLKAELDVDDLTAAVDPRIAGALLELKLNLDAAEALGEVRRRLAATRLFTAFIEAGFFPDNNWEEALDASEPALELASLSAGNDRAVLAEGFRAFTALPDEARLRRLAYLAEAAVHLEELSLLPEGTQPRWLQGPEARECDEREMLYVQTVAAADVPAKVPELAKAELGVEPGSVPEDSDEDLFVHLRCAICGKEKLLVQSP